MLATRYTLKRYFQHLLFPALLVLAFNAFSSEWLEIATLQDGSRTYFIQPNKIQGNRKLIRFWVKSVNNNYDSELEEWRKWAIEDAFIGFQTGHSNADLYKQTKPADHTLIRYKGKCDSELLGINKVIGYDKQGNITSTKSVDEEMDSVIPSSIGESLLNMACLLLPNPKKQ